MAQIPRVNKCAFCKEYEFIKIWSEKLSRRMLLYVMNYFYWLIEIKKMCVR